MRILLTGADGLLGNHLVRLLLQNNHEIRVLVQPNRNVPGLDGLAIEKIEGDLLHKDKLSGIAAGCDVIIHSAANTSVWPSRSKIVREVNVQGTLNLIEESKRSGIKKFIHVSSAAAFSPGTFSDPGDESRPYTSHKYKLDYIDSKYRAQEIVLKTSREDDFPAVVINPTFMIGPYDFTPSSGKMILAVYHRKTPGYPSGGRNFVYAGDVAQGIYNAIEKGKVGECYILGNENLSYKQFFGKVSEITGVKPPALKLNCPVVTIFGLFQSAWGLLSGKIPDLSYRMARVSCDEHFYTPVKAVRELDLPQTPIDQAILETFNWFKDNQML